MPVCQKPVMTWCDIECSNDIVTELVSVPKYKGSILGLNQFWLFFSVMSLYWISQAITWSLQDPICFDILGEFIFLYIYEYTHNLTHTYFYSFSSSSENKLQVISNEKI